MVCPVSAKVSIVTVTARAAEITKITAAEIVISVITETSTAV